MTDILKFQYCQKIVLLRNDDTEVLLARRKGEADYDGAYSFIGGKLETTDGGLIEGLRREKTEEIGPDAQVRICPLLSYNVYFVKKDGNAMILPHYYAEYQGGEIRLNDEYSDYRWITMIELAAFEPKIANIPEMVAWARRVRKVLELMDFVTI